MSGHGMGDYAGRKKAERAEAQRQRRLAREQRRAQKREKPTPEAVHLAVHHLRGGRQPDVSPEVLEAALKYLERQRP